MKKAKDEKHAPTWLEKQIVELLKSGKELRKMTFREVCELLPGKPNEATTMAALRRLLERGMLMEDTGAYSPDKGFHYVLVDQDIERKKKRAKMCVALAEKYGGVLFEDDVWCFLGTDGADKFAEAVKLEGLDVKRWRDDMAEKAQIVYA